MKLKMYSKEGNIDFLKKLSNKKVLTAEEQSALTQIENQNTNSFDTKESLINFYLTNTSNHLVTIPLVLNEIQSNKFKNILSLGSGACVMEYLLKQKSPNVEVYATDFNNFLVKKSKEYFNEIHSEIFNFHTDSVKKLAEKLKINFDLCLFYGSAYTMNDELFIKVFNELKSVGVKKIIDFHSGYAPSYELLKEYLKMKIGYNSFIRKLFKKDPYFGKFHGYSRNRSHLKKLYLKSGWKVEKEYFKNGFNYTSILI